MCWFGFLHSGYTMMLCKSSESVVKKAERTAHHRPESWVGSSGPYRKRITNTVPSSGEGCRRCSPSDFG